MSQTWEALDASGTPLAELEKLRDKCDSLRTGFSGSSEPASTTPYMIWLDTATKLVKMRNGADSSWLTIGTLGSEMHTQRAIIRVGTISASADIFIMCSQNAVTIEDVEILCSAGVTANDTDYWSFQLENVTETEDLLSAAQTTEATGGAAIVANAPYSITPDQNAALGTSEVVQLAATKAASASDLANLTIIVTYYPTGV